MSLFELQEWLGHRTPASTQYYAKITPTHLAKSFEQAGYFERNVRTIEVLIDQEAIRNGDAAGGLPRKYYDLGHGYCTYDFFERCEHRMACAHCAFVRCTRIPVLLPSAACSALEPLNLMALRYFSVDGREHRGYGNQRADETTCDKVRQSGG